MGTQRVWIVSALSAMSVSAIMSACARPSHESSSPVPPTTMTAPSAAGALDCQPRRVGIAVFDPGTRDRDQAGSVLAMSLLRAGVRAYRVAPSREKIVVVGAGGGDEFTRTREIAQRLGYGFDIEDTGAIGTDCRVVFDHPPARDPEARER